MDEIEWKPVPDFGGLYEINPLGRIRRVGRKRGARPGHVIKSHLSRDGYPQVVLIRENGKRVDRFVHRLVALAWLPPPQPGQTQVNHIDGDKARFALENLEWVSCGDNHRHAYRIGLRHANHGGLPGAANGRAKLTEAAVREIRALRGLLSQQKIAARFGVAQTQVSEIQRGVSWRNVA